MDGSVRDTISKKLRSGTHRSGTNCHCTAYLPAIGADEALRVELVCHGSDDPTGDELVAHVAVVLGPLVVFCK
jgi:hypothetical protein